MGANFTFVANAVGYHYEKTDLDRSLQRKYQEGRADVWIGRHHPELKPGLPLAKNIKHLTSVGRLLQKLAFTRPAAGDALASRLRPMLDILEKLRLRYRWSRLLDDLMAYWYWRGVAEELNARNDLFDFLHDTPAPIRLELQEVEIDLAEGLEAAEQYLDKIRPSSARIRYGPHPIGRIPPQRGAECLRGVHLRPVLATKMAWALLMALTLEGAVDRGSSIDKLDTQFSN
jgi:hypothetical protein